MAEKLTTHHAPAERSSPEIVRAQSKLFKEDTSFRVIMEAIPHIVTILNSDRQIIYANEVLLKVLGIEEMITLLGQRPGEALNCVHSKRMPGGCGTSEFCCTCGAVNAILGGLEGKEEARECRITTDDGTAFDFMVWAKPLDVTGERFVAFSVADIGDEKRRHALERIFFHDILNTAGGVRGYAEMINIADLSMEQMKDMSATIEFLATRLIDEIMAQQQLTAAENGELVAMPEEFSTLAFLEGMATLYSRHEAAEEKSITIDRSATDTVIFTDRTLLQRVVGNMIKNALEASGPGVEVVLATGREGDQVRFTVHNPAVILRDVQTQIFQRSFSTKAKDRGLGSYSMKLLTDRYLKGEVAFTSTEEEGTTFTATYPLILK
jgi:K+-sensing histidine kinase KdpD